MAQGYRPLAEPCDVEPAWTGPRAGPASAGQCRPATRTPPTWLRHRARRPPRAGASRRFRGHGPAPGHLRRRAWARHALGSGPPHVDGRAVPRPPPGAAGRRRPTPAAPRAAGHRAAQLQRGPALVGRGERDPVGLVLGRRSIGPRCPARRRPVPGPAPTGRRTGTRAHRRAPARTGHQRARRDPRRAPDGRRGRGTAPTRSIGLPVRPQVVVTEDAVHPAASAAAATARASSACRGTSGRHDAGRIDAIEPRADSAPGGHQGRTHRARPLAQAAATISMAGRGAPLDQLGERPAGRARARARPTSTSRRRARCGRDRPAIRLARPEGHPPAKLVHAQPAPRGHRRGPPRHVLAPHDLGIAAGHATRGQPPGIRGLPGQAAESAARGEALPAPRCPQGQGGPDGSTTMWPTSPANPAPSGPDRPDEPPPIPVPSVTISVAGAPAGPERYSATRPVGVVLDHHRRPSSRSRPAGRGRRAPAPQVGGEQQDARRGQPSRGPHADGAGRAGDRVVAAVVTTSATASATSTPPGRASRVPGSRGGG